MTRKGVNNKRGVSAVGVTIISVILLLVFFAIVFYGVIERLFSHDVQLGSMERWCQITVSIKNSLPASMDELWNPICTTERIKMTKGMIENAMDEGDSFEQGAIRSVYDLMRRCKFMVGGDKKGAVFSGKHCYLCYVVETADDIPTVGAQEFNLFAFLKRTDNGDSYLKDLQSPGFSNYYHEVMMQAELAKSSDYAIVYIDNIKPSDLVIFSKPLAGCVLGSQAGSNVGLSRLGCGVGLVGGLGSAFYDEVRGKNVNRIYFTKLKDLKEGGAVCGGGFEY